MKKLTQTKLILNFKKKHGNIFDYSKVAYVNRRTKVEIICNIHGSFFMNPDAHKRGQKCPKCSFIQGGLKKRMTKEQFIKKSIEIHGDKYSYDKIIYEKQAVKIIIECKKHGDIIIMPFKHLQGQGCVKCGRLRTAKKSTKTTSDFIKEAEKVHPNKYKYDEVKYINTHTPVKIKCKKHGAFYPTPNNLLNKSGCPSCSNNGFYYDKKAICYYAEIEDGKAYKIGITSRSTENRFRGDVKKVKILKTWTFSTGAKARDFERQILEQYKEFRYNGENLLRSGNTEMFSIDILNKKEVK